MPNSVAVRVADKSQDLLAVANLLFERDNAFVPVTPLADLRAYTLEKIPENGMIFVGSVDEGDNIRCCSAYTHWITGCEEEGRDQEVAVYELAATLVRSPLGGFKPITMQHVLTFARILEIVGMAVGSDEQFCLMACIVAGNKTSYQGMGPSGLGMTEFDPDPRWLQYEHRSWFPKRHDEDRVIAHEARYLWLPPDAARKFVSKMLPIADRRQPIRRTDDNGVVEEFEVIYDTPAIRLLREAYGSLGAAINELNYDVFRRPPSLFRVENSFF